MNAKHIITKIINPEPLTEEQKAKILHHTKPLQALTLLAIGSLFMYGSLNWVILNSESFLIFSFHFFSFYGGFILFVHGLFLCRKIGVGISLACLVALTIWAFMQGKIIFSLTSINFDLSDIIFLSVASLASCLLFIFRKSIFSERK